MPVLRLPFRRSQSNPSLGTHSALDLRSIRPSAHPSAVRFLAAAIFSGLALIAGSVAYYTLEVRDRDDPYVDAEEIVMAYMSVAGITPHWVRRVSGPLVSVKIERGRCVLIDVSTQYAGGEGTSDRFWIGSPSGTSRKSVDC